MLRSTLAKSAEPEFIRRSKTDKVEQTEEVIASRRLEVREPPVSDEQAFERRLVMPAVLVDKWHVGVTANFGSPIADVSRTASAFEE